jgi:hypothetical protein
MPSSRLHTSQLFGSRATRSAFEDGALLIFGVPAIRLSFESAGRATVRSYSLLKSFDTCATFRVAWPISSGSRKGTPLTHRSGSGFSGAFEVYYTPARPSFPPLPGRTAFAVHKLLIRPYVLRPCFPTLPAQKLAGWGTPSLTIWGRINKRTSGEPSPCISLPVPDFTPCHEMRGWISRNQETHTLRSKQMHTS